MSERIVAYDGQNGYAQSGGIFRMPGKEPGETLRQEVKTPTNATPAIENPATPEGNGLLGDLKRMREGLDTVEEVGEGDKEAEAHAGHRRYKKHGSVVETTEVKPRQPEIIPTRESPVIVESYPHFENATRKQVVDALRRQNVKVDVPLADEWDKMSPMERIKWRDEKGIINVTSLSADVIVDVTKDGRVEIANIDLESSKAEDIERLVEGSGAKFKKELPDDFDSMTLREKIKWGKENGISFVGRIEVGVGVGITPPLYNDNATVDIGAAYRRLSSLRNDASSLGEPLSVTDVDQLQRRIESFNVVRRVAEIAKLEPNEIINRLLELEHLETRYLGTTNFIIHGFDKERERLYEVLRLKQNNDGRINDVLDRLRDFESRGVPANDPDHKVWRGYMNHIINYVIDRRGDKQNYRFVFNAEKAVEEFEKVQRGVGDPAAVAVMDRVLSHPQRTLFTDAKNVINTYFEGIEQTNYVARTRRDALQSLYSPVDTEAISFRSSIKYGSLKSIREVEQHLFDVPHSAVEMAERNEPATEQGLIEWHTVKTLEEMQIRQVGENEMGVPLDWNDSKRNVDNNLRFAESGDFSESDLGAVRNRIIEIADSLNQRINQMKAPGLAAERKRAEDMLSEINELRDAVLAIYDLRLVMEGKDMNPEEVVQHFATHIWKDTTFKTYFGRFFKDEDGEDFQDTAGTFNIQDRAMQVFFKRLAKERRILNQVEALTIVDISRAFSGPNDPRFAEMAALMGRRGRAFTALERTNFENLRANLAHRMQLKHTMATAREKEKWDLRVWASSNAKIINTASMKTVINEWYREETLLGAFGTDLANGKLRSDNIREDMLGQFRAELVASGGRVAAKIDQYERNGLLNQVMNNAYHLSWSLGALSDYDGIRVWNRSDIWFKNTQRGNVYKLGSYVFNNRSDLFNGRMIDHYTEFLQDERRGRPRDANFIFTKHMIGKNRSVLGHNRLMGKIISDNLAMGTDPTVADSLVVGGGGRGRYAALLDHKMHNIENGDRLDLKDQDDSSWLKGASIEELLQDGELTLENVKWSEIFNSDDQVTRKFNMGDWWGDRAAAYKYFQTGAMQQYLKTPGTKVFFEMNENIFYSKREIRIQPWMKLVIPAHKELGSHWQSWWKMPYDMPHAEIERVIYEAARLNMLRYTYVDGMRDKYLGWGPFSGNDMFGLITKARYLAEDWDRNGRELGKDSWQMPFGWFAEFAKVGAQQSGAQLQGK